MLTVIILKIIPSNLTLEFNRQQAESISNVDVFNLLKLMQKEIRSHEPSFFDQNPSTKESDPPKKSSWRNFK